MSSQTLAYLVLSATLVGEGMALGYQFPKRPLPFWLVSTTLEIAAVWLAIKSL